jgi:hypothetical protein
MSLEDFHSRLSYIGGQADTRNLLDGLICVLSAQDSCQRNRAF